MRCFLTTDDELRSILRTSSYSEQDDGRLTGILNENDDAKPSRHTAVLSIDLAKALAICARRRRRRACVHIWLGIVLFVVVMCMDIFDLHWLGGHEVSVASYCRVQAFISAIGIANLVLTHVAYEEWITYSKLMSHCVRLFARARR